jgi:transposase
MKHEDMVAILTAENAHQREQIATLAAQNAELAERVQELEARLANATKDSHTSHKPPASDPLGRKRPRSQRKRSGKAPGGQIGHRGETLHLVAVPDAVVEHRPAVCAQCRAPLDNVDEAAVVLRERRPVQDLPRVRLAVTEHQALHVCCPACLAVTVGSFPAEAPSRAQYGPRLRALGVYLVEQQLAPYGRVREVVADLFEAELSLGTLVEWVQQAPVLHSDETGVRQAGQLVWVPVASTSSLTQYGVHPKRGAEATSEIGILPTYRGVSMHDGWKPYRTHTRCRHALCNIHHLRELTFLEEQYGQTWAKELKGLLREMKAVTDRAPADGVTQLPLAERADFVARYNSLLAMGLAPNPPPPRPPRRRGRMKQSPARNLLERLWLGREEVLAFLAELSIPFDNTQAERDLRMLKVQQKVSGCFRSTRGGATFGRIRSYLSPLSKQGMKRLAALESLFAGQPLSPSFV